MGEQVGNPLSREASLRLATELERIGARLDASDSPRLSAEEREQLVSLAEDALASRNLHALGDDPVVQAVNDMPEAHQLAAMGVARALARHDAADAENPFQSARLAQVYTRERQYTAYLAERQERDGAPDVATGRREAINVLRESIDDWGATAAAYSEGLIGERNFLLDAHGRAFSLLDEYKIEKREPESWEKAFELVKGSGEHVAFSSFRDSMEHLVERRNLYKFEQPPRDMKGVLLLNEMSAKTLLESLAEKHPDQGPFVVRDVRDYALEKRDEAEAMLREVSSASDSELVFQTTGSFVDLEIVGANVPDDHMEFLLGHNAVVYGRNQDGLVVSVMTDMDFETPIPTAMTAAPYAPNLHVGRRGNGEIVLGEKPSRFFAMEAVDGTVYNDVVRSERFDAVVHVEQLEAACAYTWKSLDAEARQLVAELREGGGISQTQAVTLVAHLRENGITFDSDSRQWTVQSDTPGLSEALEDAGVQVAIRVAEGKSMAQEQNRDLVVHIESTGNAAFKDAGVGIELARLIEVAATKVREMGDNALDAPLFDLNGNRVGRVALVPEDETKQLQPKVGEAVAVVYASERDGMADTLARVADSIRSGAHAVSASEAHFEYNAPTLQNDHGIDMSKAFDEGRVFMADGIEAGAYRFVVTDYSFEPGYHQGEGDAWLVNALGEPASGYEDGPDTIREVNLRELRRDEKEALQKVIDRTWSLDDLERHLDDDEPELG
ncbi:hypothetical protein [Xanthomonas vasicola]|nr:hypothetical protein [Xanthomonas vasicola]MDO6948416.1 hypothetical protein [Xanthomonas vasicola]MDO6960546.1 hypothetical protein [Xanthomonas vasicola]